MTSVVLPRSLKQASDVVFPHACLQGRPLQTKPGGCPVRSSDHSVGFLQRLQYARARGGLGRIR